MKLLILTILTLVLCAGCEMSAQECRALEERSEKAKDELLAKQIKKWHLADGEYYTTDDEPPPPSNKPMYPSRLLPPDWFYFHPY